MRATAPVTTIVPATAIAELYGTYRSQFNTRKKDVSGTTVLLEALFSLLIQISDSRAGGPPSREGVEKAERRKEGNPLFFYGVETNAK
jgi:hypothetical protein